MANPFADTLELQPRPSRVLKYFLVGTHAVAVAVVFCLTLRQPGFGLLLPAIVGSFAWYWRRASLTDGAAVARITWHGDGTCRWVERGGRVRRGSVGASSLVLSWLVILHLRAGDGRRVYLPLPADSLPSQTFRRLRARLRLAAPAAND